MEAGGLLLFPVSKARAIQMLLLGWCFLATTALTTGLMPTTYGYFEPRVGVVWQAHPDTVVRSGFGMFTTPLEDAFYNHVWDAAPFAPAFSLNATATVPLNFDKPWSGLRRPEV